jgi:hypothetical protein
MAGFNSNVQIRFSTFERPHLSPVTFLSKPQSVMQIVLLPYNKSSAVEYTGEIFPHNFIDLLQSVIPEAWPPRVLEAANRLLQNAEFLSSKFKTPEGVFSALIAVVHDDVDPRLVESLERLAENIEQLSSQKVYVRICPSSSSLVPSWLVKLKLTVHIAF